MDVYPTRLERIDDQHVLIQWSDGQKRRYAAGQLRQHCPCATCREKHQGRQANQPLLPVLSPEEAQPLAIRGMQPLGNYAYTIAFSDGHDTGIYSIELLRWLGEEIS